MALLILKISRFRNRHTLPYKVLKSDGRLWLCKRTGHAKEQKGQEYGTPMPSVWRYFGASPLAWRLAWNAGDA
jgi:hypothetical protein